MKTSHFAARGTAGDGFCRRKDLNAPLILDPLTKVWRLPEMEPSPAPNVPRWAVIVSTVLAAMLIAIGCAELPK